jgi:hypothetical protein
MAYPTVTQHPKGYPFTSVMASPFSADNTGATDVYAAFMACFAYLSNSGTVLIPKGTYKLSQNMTVSTGISLIFMSGAQIQVAAGKALTIDGTIIAPLEEIITGSWTPRSDQLFHLAWLGLSGLVYPAFNSAGYLKNTAAGAISGGNDPNSDILALDAVKIANGTVTNAEFQYLGGVTSDIQTQLNTLSAAVSGTYWTSPSGLIVKNNAVAPNTQIDIDANSVSMANAAVTAWITSSSVNLTVNCAGVGANGLDAGALANNTWYYFYVIYDSIGGTTAGLVSTSATAPTLPGTYDYKKLVGVMRTDGSAHFLLFIQYGNTVNYYLERNEASGLTAAAYASQALAYIPPNIAVRWRVKIDISNATSDFALSLDGTNKYTGQYGPIQNSVTIPIVTSQTIYYQRNSGTGNMDLWTLGFELNL